ncbi:MAG: hypothetical protein PHX87_04875 [Candidatus Peribacteraceae bacterium]|nr:hypothetical protein [Candidatus Peribacteraceae bacterium]MDD5742729.1 hypothetical protein [Candidatus Peribacteraceae bacterium]
MPFQSFFRRSSESLREKRLLCRNVEVLPEQVLETFMQDNAAVDRLERAVGTLDETSPVYRAMLERSKSLTEQQRSVIDSNCQRLQAQAKARAETLRKISLLQNGINVSRQTSSTPVSAAEKNGLERAWDWTAEKAHKGWEWTQDKAGKTWEWSKENPVPALAIGGTVTLGVYSLYRLWKWWKGEPKQEQKAEASEKKSSGWFWKVMLGVPVVGILGWGVYEGVQWMKKNLGSLDQAKAFLARAENRLKSMVGLGNKAEQYGLSEDAYQNAVRAYREIYQENPEQGTKAIRSAFRLKDDEASPDCQKFMEDMGKKFERKLENGIQYAHGDVAIENYEQHFESALKHLEQWIVGHRYEALFAAYIAHRFSLLLPIIRGGGSAAARVLSISKEMATWGIRHPIISLFAAGGAVLGMRAAVRAGKELWMPENFTQLGKAFSEGKPIVLGLPQGGILDKIGELKDHVVEFVRSGEDFGPWVLKKLGQYVTALDEKIPELLGTSREKIVFENNSAGLGNLKRWLEERKENAPTSTEDMKEKIGEKCTNALAQLEAFQTVFLADRCGTQVVSGTRPQEALKPLQQALESMKITLVVGADGILRWKQQSGSEIDLCVDPAVADKDEIFRISSRMRFGEESDVSHFCSRIVQHSQLLLGEGTEKGKSVPFAGRSNVVAMVIGQFLYAADLRNIRDFVIFKVPRDMVSGLWNEPTKLDKAATVASGFAETGLFSLSAGVLGTTIKRFAVGGGPIFRFNGKEILQGSIPVWAQWKMIRDTYRGSKDVSLMKYLVSEHNPGSGFLNRFSGYRRSWYINTVLGKAGIKNIAWIGIIEHSQSVKELDKIAGKLGMRHLLQKGMSPDQMRNVLKIHIFDRMKKVKMLQFSLRNWGTRLVIPGPIGDYQAIWHDTLRWNNARTGLPPPLPITPPPLPASVAVTPPLPASIAAVPPLPATASATPSPLPATPPPLPKTASRPLPLPKSGAQPPPLPRAPATPPPLPKPKTVPPPLPQSPSAPAGAPAQPATKPASSPPPLPERQPVSSTSTATEAPPSKLTPADRGVRPNVPNGEGASALDGQPEGVKQAARQTAAAETAAASAAAAEIPAAAPGARHLESILSDERIAKALAGAKDATDIEKALRAELAALEPKTLNMIAESGRAKKLLSGAIVSGKAPEIARIANAARRATYLKAGWNGVGAVGDVYGIYMAWCDYEQNKERILQTDNPDLKLLYSRANYLYAAEGASSAAGLLLGGIAIYQSVAAGNALIVALGAPAGMVMLPIAALAFGARVTYQKCEESTEYHLLNSRDMQKKYTPGQILEHIGKSSRLENVNWAQDFFLNAETARRANENARWEGYDAYFAQIAAEHIRPASIMDIDADSISSGVAGDPKAMQTFLENAINVQQTERISTFVRAADRYVAYKTQGSFKLVTSEVLRNAALYAEIQFDQWERTGSADARPKDDATYWEEMELNVVSRAAESSKLIMADVSKFASDPVQFEREAPGKLLYLLRDELADCERRLITKDYSNWSNGANWIPFKNWYGDRDLQMVARGVVAEQLFDVLQQAVDGVRQKKSFSETEARQLHARLRTVLTQDFDTLAVENMSKENVGTLRYVGEQTSRLGMVNILRLFGAPVQSAHPAEKEQGSDRGLHQKVTAGTALMERITANHDGSYYTKQFGWMGNKFLYMRFDEGQGKWLAGLWNLEELKDPATFCCTMWGGSEKYNRLLEDLAAINRGEEPSQ